MIIHMDTEELFLRNVHIRWDEIPEESYLRTIPALSSLKDLPFHAPVTIFSGENGSGKSTLLEAVAISLGFNPEGGTRNYSFSTYDSHSSLSDVFTLTRGYRKMKYGYFLRAESFYNVATMEERYSAEDPRGRALHLHERSHGESFLVLAQNNFHGNGIYLLDEPEAALSPQRQLSLLKIICDAVKEGAQFIIATHSPILSAIPGAEILSFDEGEIHPISYEETGAYKISSLFINRREKILEELLKEDDND